jgi:hypothetical protein
LPLYVPEGIAGQQVIDQFAAPEQLIRLVLDRQPIR